MTAKTLEEEAREALNPNWSPHWKLGFVGGYKVAATLRDKEIEELRARESRWVEEEEYERLFKSGQWKSVELAYRGRRLWLMAFVPPIPLPGEKT